MGDGSARARFEQTLKTAIAMRGLAVPEGAVERLGQHYDLLVRWAKRINLTTVTDPIEAAYRHAFDSLLFTEAIAREDTSSAVDVGSGAGFPGLVVAVARPHLRMTLLEPIRKRASFLRVAAAELQLDTRVTEGKLDGGVAGPPWPTDLVISRATIPPLSLIPLAAPVLVPGGRLLMTGGQGMPGVSEVIPVAEAAGLHHQRRYAQALPDGAPRWLDELRRPGDARERDG